MDRSRPKAALQLVVRCLIGTYDLYSRHSVSHASGDEEMIDQRTAWLRFDIELLSDRLVGATEWLGQWTLPVPGSC